MKIFKYPLALLDEQEIEIVGHIETLSAIEQHGKIVIYALIDETDRVPVKRTIFIHGTGHTVRPEVTLGAKFLGTLVMPDGIFVWHVFEAEYN